MKTLINPPYSDWEQYCERPVFPAEDLEEKVTAVLEEVRLNGDVALKRLTSVFDHVTLENIKVSFEETEKAKSEVSEELKQAIAVAADNIRTFHSAQQITEATVETMPGIKCWRKSVAIEKVGLYIPGGSAPLFSTILMLGIPALIAGCRQIVLCTPPDRNGNINPAVLYTASFLGITDIYKVGGAQAIAALAYGTETIPKVDKIFGPGNQYVTKAKELVQKSGIAIDLPAGPSEVLVIADSSGDADFVASDLLSQAEHGPDSQVVLLSDSAEFVENVKDALTEQLTFLPRASVAEQALHNSFSVVLNSVSECLDFSNLYAPEHLILAVEDAEGYADQIQNAGSVF
ncbi:MAG: histidinol dehydrogenase, partial [Kaistella sp.]